MNRDLVEQVRRVVVAAADLLFPQRCAACGRAGMILCQDCVETFERLAGPLCRMCSVPLNGMAGCCERCAVNPPAFTQVLSGYVYKGALRQSILAFKYGGQVALSSALGSICAQAVAKPPEGGICAVPMHPKSRQRRGYNHAELLAEELAYHWGYERFPSSTLQRTRLTPRQASLNLADRLKNVDGAFTATRLVTGTRVLVVDDVCTTGATMQACADALLAAGASEVYGITLARTV